MIDRQQREDGLQPMSLVSYRVAGDPDPILCYHSIFDESTWKSEIHGGHRETE